MAGSNCTVGELALVPVAAQDLNFFTRSNVRVPVLCELCARPAPDSDRLFTQYGR